VGLSYTALFCLGGWMLIFLSVASTHIDRPDRLHTPLNAPLFFIGNNVPLLPLLKSLVIGRIDHYRASGASLTPHQVQSDDQSGAS
jgi:hypothetical protein